MEDRGTVHRGLDMFKTLMERRDKGGGQCNGKIKEIIRVGRGEARRGLEQSSLGLEEGQSTEGVKAPEDLTWGDGRGWVRFQGSYSG